MGFNNLQGLGADGAGGAQDGEPAPFFSAFHKDIIRVGTARGLKSHHCGIAELQRENIASFIDACSSPEGMEADAALREERSRLICFADSCIFDFFSGEHTAYRG